MSGQQDAPAALYPRGKTRYPYYRRLGGASGPVWTGGKSLSHHDSIPDRPQNYIIRMIKSRKMRKLDHVTRRDKRNN
jgi:hypothetical protein